MTNDELLRTSKEMLNEVDKQRLFLLRTDGTPVPCPACKRPVNVFGAAGIDLDAYDFGRTKYEYHCPACGAELEQIVPLLGGGGPMWHWQLKAAWLQEQIRKAKECDSQGPAGREAKPT